MLTLNSDKNDYLALKEFVEIVNAGRNQPPAARAKSDEPMAAPSIGPATREGIAFFEKHIRPVLVNHHAARCGEGNDDEGVGGYGSCEGVSDLYYLLEVRKNAYSVSHAAHDSPFRFSSAAATVATANNASSVIVNRGCIEFRSRT